VLPVLRQLDQLAVTAYRCRVVNRAFGTALGPDEIAGLLPEEDIDLLVVLVEHDQIGDAETYLKLFLRSRHG
jgi:hypothetical protein